MTFVLTVVFFMYIFLSLITFLGADTKRPLSKEVQRMLLDKIKSGTSLSFDNGRDGDGWIYTYPHKLRFRWYPFLIRYTFDELGWIPFWSPLAKELKGLSKRAKKKDAAKKLTKYGLGDGLC